MSEPRTLFGKIWDSHLARAPLGPGLPATLYIDLHLVHEVTSPQAFRELETRGLKVRRPHQTLATMDHSTPTDPSIGRQGLVVLDPKGAEQLDQLEANCKKHGVPLHPLGSEHQGIVHVIGPELGLTQPGMTVVCGDSHTSTHGAFGALAFGIGTSEVGHVLATQCLAQQRSKTFEIVVRGKLGEGVSAKDLILLILSKIGIHGGTGHVLEYRGEAISALDMEGRMTICNMSIEGGARAGLIAPDDTTFAYIEGRPHAPKGAAWERAVESWRQLPTDDGAAFDRSLEIDASDLEPMITFGTNPGMAMPIRGHIPQPGADDDPESFVRALEYMGVESGQQLLDHPIDVVFVGSCTNSRLSDLSAAAEVLRGKRVSPHVKMLVVPGSQQVKRAAEERGLDRIFLDAGAEWREAGCSMCLAMNSDRVEPGQFALSTTNRNFEGRQGPGSRTFLASPQTAAATAVRGRISDARELLS